MYTDAPNAVHKAAILAHFVTESVMCTTDTTGLGQSQLPDLTQRAGRTQIDLSFDLGCGILMVAEVTDPFDPFE